MVAALATTPAEVLDEAMRRDPKTIDYPALVEALRRDRALYIASEEKKAAHKRGETEDEDDEAEGAGPATD